MKNFTLDNTKFPKFGLELMSNGRNGDINARFNSMKKI